MAKILVVDDEKDVVELVKFMLEREGHQIIEAYDGEEGLAKARQEIPDLIVLDIMMPKMDGYTMHSHLLQSEATSSIPVIILTAKGQMKDLFVMAGNVVVYIEKPFDPKVLREKVKQILAKK